jgi:hypothetical protein
MRPRLRIGLIAAGLIATGLVGLAGCASDPAETHVASRDLRSQEYCLIRAQSAGYADFDVAAACRRAEVVAAARVRVTHIDAELDQACEKEATIGQADGPFSWRAYMRCVDNSI